MREFTRELSERRTDEASLRCTALPIHADSGLAHKSLRESGIGQHNKCLVIGIEINERIEMSPKADTIFEPGNKLWVVGEEQDISSLIEENLPKIISPVEA